MADGGFNRIVVRIDPDEHSELAAELAPLHERSRAGRLRLLASMGLLYLRAQQSGSMSLSVVAAATSPPVGPATTEATDTASAPEPPMRKYTSAAGAMNGVDRSGTSGTAKT